MVRRMFSPKIVSSDAFLDMPISTQALYFHLGMEADDDGFVNPKRIMRVVGASDDDLKVLLGKRFVLVFDNGVIVIKHWLIHNQIRKDRYNETQYLEEKQQLKIKENNSYTEVRQPDGNQRVPQYRLGKDSIGKDRGIPSNKEDFNKFWEQYPKKVEKKRAEERWNRLSFEIQNQILTDIPKRKEGKQWKEQDGRFVPNPLTYLNGERWNDVIEQETIKINSIKI